MDDPRELEHLKNYKPSIEDLKMKSPQFIPDNYGKKRLGKSYIQTVEEILNVGENKDSVHDAPIMDRNQNEAIRFLAEQIDTLWQIVEAYKTGKL